MRVLVYPHLLSIGGSQLAAIDCAAAVRDRGHDVLVFGQPGALTEHITAVGLPYLRAPEPQRRPSRGVMAALRRVVAAEHIDVVHAYEWPPALEAFYALANRPGTTVVCTVMSMAIAPFLPEGLPLLVGTRQLQEHTQRGRYGPVGLLEPPVDVKANRPDGSGAAFRRRWDLAADRPTIVCVSRMAHQLKLDGLARSIRAVGTLAAAQPVQLVLVGDGPARAELEALAHEVNRGLGWRCVLLTGALADPRPAYDCADIVLGMGASILRGMAFAKPAICLGEQGFAQVVSPESLDEFLWQGFYGVGDDRDGDDRLRRLLAELLADPGRRDRLAAYSRALVRDRFSQPAAGATLERFYTAVSASAPARTRLAADAAVTAGGLLRYKLTQRLLRWRGRRALDDFNARPLAGRAPSGRHGRHDPQEQQ